MKKEDVCRFGRKRARKKRAAAARKRKVIRKHQKENYRIRQLNIALLAFAGVGYLYIRQKRNNYCPFGPKIYVIEDCAGCESNGYCDNQYKGVLSCPCVQD